MGRIDREKKTIKLMIDIYCHKKHGNNKGDYVKSVQNY